MDGVKNYEVKISCRYPVDNTRDKRPTDQSYSVDTGKGLIYGANTWDTMAAFAIPKKKRGVRQLVLLYDSPVG